MSIQKSHERALILATSSFNFHAALIFPSLRTKSRDLLPYACGRWLEFKMHFISLPHTTFSSTSSRFFFWFSLSLVVLFLSSACTGSYLAFQDLGFRAHSFNRRNICIFMNGMWSRQVHLKPRALVEASRERRGEDDRVTGWMRRA